jgi:hypothetical protein
MNFTIEELSQLSGNRAKIYTVRIENEEQTIFEEFLNRYVENYADALQNILTRIQTIGKVGARDEFFKLNEGKPGDGLVALFEVPGKKLRLYAIKYNDSYIILGSGGIKEVRTWQEDPVLNFENKRLQEISKRITHRMKERELSWSEEKKSLIGNLDFNDED